MKSQTSDTAIATPTSVRSLYVVWQNPKTREFVRIGEVSRLADETFVFTYTDNVKGLVDFYPLSNFPDVTRRYVSESLAPFFQNRVMTTRRPNYAEFLEWLGLDSTAQADPLEVMARTGGSRATDTFHLVEKPPVGQTTFEVRFFISGVRHMDSSTFNAVTPGSKLQRLSDRSNPEDSSAQKLLTLNDVQLGWVPRWLNPECDDWEAQGYELEVELEKVNWNAPPHVQFLCRMTATLSR